MRKRTRSRYYEYSLNPHADWSHLLVEFLTYLDDGTILHRFDHSHDAMVYAQSQATARDRSVFVCPDIAPFFEMEFKPVYTFKT